VEKVSKLSRVSERFLMHIPLCPFHVPPALHAFANTTYCNDPAETREAKKGSKGTSWAASSRPPQQQNAEKPPLYSSRGHAVI
jgi:hypothetical protein